MRNETMTDFPSKMNGDEETAPAVPQESAESEVFPFPSHSAKYKHCEFSTKAVHIGQVPDPVTGLIVPPIYFGSTFARDSPFTHKGYDYSRAGNPSFAVLEQQIASLENGKYAIACSSGLAAIAAIFSDLRQGDHVVAYTSCYGGTYRLLVNVFENYGVNVHFGIVGDWDNLEKLLKEKTPRFFIFESPTNPLLEVIDIRRAADLARTYGAISIVDNTFASPYIQRPLELGADVVVHSSTKYLGGHADVINGVVITNNEDIKDKVQFHRKAVGMNPSPIDCWLLSRSLKTLSLRMERHSSNAMALAQYLSQHPMVSRVYYPGLESHPDHALACKQFMNGFGGMVSAEFKLDTLDEVLHLIKSFKLFILAESLGGVESLVDHPSTMTHASIPEAERLKFGLTNSLVRFSVGVENIEDLIEDIEDGLKAVKGLNDLKKA